MTARSLGSATCRGGLAASSARVTAPTASSPGSCAASTRSRSIRTEVSIRPAAAVQLQPRGAISWLATRSRSARNRRNSTGGAPMNRRRGSGEGSPTATRFRVTTKDSPWSSLRIISPLLSRSSRWVISLATAEVFSKRSSTGATCSCGEFRGGSGGAVSHLPPQLAARRAIRFARLATSFMGWSGWVLLTGW